MNCAAANRANLPRRSSSPPARGCGCARRARRRCTRSPAGRCSAHALAALRAAGASALAVVVGPERDDVAAAARAFAPESEIFVQRERRGTAHATLAAGAAIARGFDDVLVVYADAPLLTSASLLSLRQALADGAGLAALGFEASDPTGYGRMIERDGALHRDPRTEGRKRRRAGDSPLQRRARWRLPARRRSPCWKRSAATTRRRNST